MIRIAMVLGSLLFIVVPDGVAGGITKLPGGVKCADLFNNDQPVCVFEIQVGTITLGTPADVRYLIDHRDSYPRKIWGSAIYLDSLGGTWRPQLKLGDLSEIKRCLPS
jgi:hypothetical protein